MNKKFCFTIGGLLAVALFILTLSSPALAGEPTCNPPSNDGWSWQTLSDGVEGWHLGPLGVDNTITVTVPSWIQIVYWSFGGTYVGSANSGQIAGPLHEATAFCIPPPTIHKLFLPVVSVSPPTTGCGEAPSSDPHWQLVSEENGVRMWQVGPLAETISFTTAACDLQVDWSLNGIGHSDPNPAGKIFTIHAATVWRQTN